MNHKTMVGDYEVDTIVGDTHSQHILTMNDRKTGKLWLWKLNERPRKRHGFPSPDAV